MGLAIAGDNRFALSSFRTRRKLPWLVPESSLAEFFPAFRGDLAPLSPVQPPSDYAAQVLDCCGHGRRCRWNLYFRCALEAVKGHNWNMFTNDKRQRP